MFEKNKHLCTNCKTGKASYELDIHSEACPYISSYENNKCIFYKPLKKEKNILWNKILDAFSLRK